MPRGVSSAIARRASVSTLVPTSSGKISQIDWPITAWRSRRASCTTCSFRNRNRHRLSTTANPSVMLSMMAFA